MKHKGKWIVGAAVFVALFAGSSGIALAGGADDNEVPIKGSALEEAGAAALEHTDGGKVTETEVGDEEGYYEVEVALPNGKQIDVHLDREFKVLSSEADSDDKPEEIYEND